MFYRGILICCAWGLEDGSYIMCSFTMFKVGFEFKRSIMNSVETQMFIDANYFREIVMYYTQCIEHESIIVCFYLDYLRLDLYSSNNIMCTILEDS